MAKLKRSNKEPKGELKWRSKQKKGAIMKPSTFKAIEKKAKAEGATNPKAVAGKAYWDTVRSKYQGRKKIAKKKQRM